MTSTTIIETSWLQNRTALSKIRRAVFIEEQMVPEDMEWDDFDEGAIHFLAFTHQHPVGCTRLLAEGKITRMAVLSEYRGLHIGAALLTSALQKTKILGLASVTLDAQLSAQAFYTKYGFQPQGSIFMDAGIPHIKMTSSLF